MISDYCADESRWRPIELSTTADVAALDALLADGWRLERIDIEGLPFLAFCGRGRAMPRRQPAIAPALRGRASQRLLLILQHAGSRRRTQRALFVERSPTGYIEMRNRPVRTTFVAVFPIGSDATVAIYELR